MITSLLYFFFSLWLGRSVLSVFQRKSALLLVWKCWIVTLNVVSQLLESFIRIRRLTWIQANRALWPSLALPCSVWQTLFLEAFYQDISNRSISVESWLLCTWMKQLLNGGGQTVSNKCNKCFTANHSRYGQLKNWRWFDFLSMQKPESAPYWFS